MGVQVWLYGFSIDDKSAAESHCLLVEAYKKHAPSVSMCEKWFKRFRSNDLDLDDKEHGKLPKKFESAELKAYAWRRFMRNRKPTSMNTFESSSEGKTTRMRE